jgi:cysteine synthase A
MAVTAFCDFVGTVGSFGGCAAYFQPSEGVKCYVVEPSGAAVLSGKEVTRPNHRLQGGGYAMKLLPAISSISEGESSSIDGYLEVTDELAIQTIYGP